MNLKSAGTCLLSTLFTSLLLTTGHYEKMLDDSMKIIDPVDMAYILNKPVISHSDLTVGGVFEMEMGDMLIEKHYADKLIVF
jgi:hypothetical protein